MRAMSDRRPARLWAPSLLAMIALSAAPIFKIGDVQAVELLQVLLLALAAPAFVYGGMKIPAFGAWRRYGGKYALFLVLALCLSLFALRLPFYPPPEVSAIKQPVLLSLSRIFEFILAMYFTLASARALARNRVLLRLALDVYTEIGVLSAAGSLAAWLLVKTAGVSSFLVYGYDDRVRGLFNEGGPYGVFLVSVAVALFLRCRLFPPRRPLLHSIAQLILLAGLFASGSKAGLLAAIVLCVVAAAASGSRIRRVALAGACAVILIGSAALFQGKLFGYFYAYLNFDEALAYRPGDPSLIMGRIAASLIVPRIISAHPLAGIGVGNYSLMRNDPDYLQGLPPVDDWDLPGVGLLGSAAELGIPLAAFFLAVLLWPMIRARKRGAPAVVVAAASFQPVAFLVGVNLNFFYPWLMAAFVISLEELSAEQ
jgi:hypothetical protein